MARPPQGLALVDRFEGSEEEKKRLKAVLSLLSEKTCAEDACRELGIERARFYEIVKEALGGALSALKPRPPGRPPKPPPSAEQEKIRALETRIEDLELDLRAAEVREELALAFPWYAERRAAREKKRAAKTRHR